MGAEAIDRYGNGTYSEGDVDMPERHVHAKVYNNFPPANCPTFTRPAIGTFWHP